MNNSEIIVIDNIIDLDYQKQIKGILLGDINYKDYEFPWYYTKDVTKSDSPNSCLLYTSPSPRDATLSRMPSSA